jgi:hypothetical protein
MLKREEKRREREREKIEKDGEKVLKRKKSKGESFASCALNK